MKAYDLSRFTKAQENYYPTALKEIQNGLKTGHWIWFIFPQLKELGYSTTALHYGIEDLDEAKAYLQNAELKSHLLEISSALLDVKCDDIKAIVGSVDAQKIRSSMTLFSIADTNEIMYKSVLDKYYGGKPDKKTIELLKIEKTEKHNENA